jgi:hypothetical protein
MPEIIGSVFFETNFIPLPSFPKMGLHNFNRHHLIYKAHMTNTFEQTSPVHNICFHPIGTTREQIAPHGSDQPSALPLENFILTTPTLNIVATTFG